MYRGVAVAACFWAGVAGVAVPYARWTHARNAEWRSQRALFDAALRVAPGSAKVRLNAGIAAWEAAQPAVDAAQRGAAPASSLAPGTPAGDQLEDALRHYAAAEAVEPAFDAFCQPHYWAGRARLDMRDFPRAIARFQRALACRELDHDRYAREALETVYAERLRHAPSDAGAASNLANVLLLAGGAGEAARAFKRALTLHAARGRAPSSDVLCNFARCRRVQGRLKGARKLYRRALEGDPRSARAAQGLAEVEAALGGGGGGGSKGSTSKTKKKKRRKKAREEL